MSRAWYVAYGSNLYLARFRCYLEGGHPAGSSRLYPGCRDSSEPTERRAVELSGTLYFAGRSTVWGGGRAYLDTNRDGRVAAVAYNLTVSQLSDVVAQEKRQDPGHDLDLDAVRPGHDLDLGPVGYQVLTLVGNLDGLPMLAITAADHDQSPTAPARAYVHTIAVGLREAHRWAPKRVGRYLAQAPGASGVWTPEEIAALAREPMR